jgi:hypothetical protein
MKTCKTCNNYRDPCEGRERACKDWAEIDLDGEQGDDPVVVEAQEEPQNAPESTIPVEADPESPLDKFSRLSEKRLAKVLEALRILENLTDGYHRKKTGVTVYKYAWKVDDAKRIVTKLSERVGELRERLTDCPAKRENGLIDGEIEEKS